ncbi:uncharacterized protein LOC105695609 isoform X2 [Orussus abietinus]|nr:uncharacterized protein LOC105695609 isoform X2 [Orussus abietinus]
MTDNIRAEMNYYKQLALAVEEKLKILQNTRPIAPLEHEQSEENIQDKTSKTISCESTTYDSLNSEVESPSFDSTTNTKSIIDIPTREKELLIKSNSEDRPTNATELVIEKMVQQQKFVSDDENHYQTGSQLGRCASVDTTTGSTDLNQYLNESTSTRSTTSETTPETWKPQVPKTLDIVPIVVDCPILESNGNQSDCSKKLTLGKCGPIDETPKLIRQGSYVLETPSPVLLAHMQSELVDSNYVPSTTIGAGTKRKEWNITQAKTDWELRNKELVMPRTNRAMSESSSRRSIGSSNGHRGYKSMTYSRKVSLGSRHNAKSVDCLQAILAKECVSRHANNREYSHNERCDSNANSFPKCYGMPRWKSNRNVSILNLANKLGGSLGSLDNVGTQNYRCIESRNGDGISPNGNLVWDEPKNVQQISQQAQKPAMSEKILKVFREIRGTHESQMMELMARQRKEQSNMQLEFEKQQILLLDRIKKTFPEISIAALVDSITDDIIKKSTPSNGKTSVGISPNDLPSQIEPSNDSLPNSRISSEPWCLNPNDRSDLKCPLNYIYPVCSPNRIEACKSVSDYNIRSCERETAISVNEPTKQTVQRYDSDVTAIETKKICTTDRRQSSVSRQLFPLDCRTMHVPVLDNSLYSNKHIHAATIINAYARGYLVRRMMKTEKVVTLKNTFRETLHFMLRLHVDAPLNLPEYNFLKRLKLQCDAVSMNIAELFSQNSMERMQIIAQDREIKKSRAERPSSARSYSFATQRTLARKKLKEMGQSQTSNCSRSSTMRTRCQTWTSNIKEKRSPSILYQGIKRSTSAGTVRKPWR